mmetsp:Transcript_83856/g.234963  ORF Transcript_83856/g.234963 Transcript_83856/m.234963 type:complete len:231 (+) Transcript_83856:1599-2291(+)
MALLDLLRGGERLRQPLPQLPNADGRAATVQEPHQGGVGAQALLWPRQHMQRGKGGLIQVQKAGQRVQPQRARCGIRRLAQNGEVADERGQGAHSVLPALLFEVTPEATICGIDQQPQEILLEVHLLLRRLRLDHGDAARLRHAPQSPDVLRVRCGCAHRPGLDLQQQRLCAGGVGVLDVLAHLEGSPCLVEDREAKGAVLHVRGRGDDGADRARLHLGVEGRHLRGPLW